MSERKTQKIARNARIKKLFVVQLKSVMENGSAGDVVCKSRWVEDTKKSFLVVQRDEVRCGGSDGASDIKCNL